MQKRKKSGPPPKDPKDRKTVILKVAFTPRQVKASGGENAMKERMEHAATNTQYDIQAVEQAAIDNSKNEQQ